MVAPLITLANLLVSLILFAIEPNLTTSTLTIVAAILYAAAILQR